MAARVRVKVGFDLESIAEVLLKSIFGVSTWLAMPVATKIDD
tara:strand:+ start:224 stop:349 length:126 start_codon:yes stop_codon:yes gene_type:complete